MICKMHLEKLLYEDTRVASGGEEAYFPVVRAYGKVLGPAAVKTNVVIEEPNFLESIYI